MSGVKSTSSYLHIHTPFTGGSNLYHIKLIACVQMKGHNIMHIRMSFFCCSYKLSLNCFSWSRYRWITIRLQQSRLWTRHNWLYCLHRINGLFITYYRGVTHVNCTASDGKLSEGLARLRVAIVDWRKSGCRICEISLHYETHIPYLLDQTPLSISRCSRIVAGHPDVLNEIVAALEY